MSIFQIYVVIGCVFAMLSIIGHWSDKQYSTGTLVLGAALTIAIWPLNVLAALIAIVEHLRFGKAE